MSPYYIYTTKAVKGFEKVFFEMDGKLANARLEACNTSVIIKMPFMI